jgi:hypothetical protein
MGNHNSAIYLPLDPPGSGEEQALHEINVKAESSESERIHWEHEQRLEQERERVRRQQASIEFQVYKRMIL